MLRRIGIGALVLALAALGYSPGWAQETGVGFEPNPREGITQVGTRGANFLRIGVSARSMALGESTTAYGEQSPSSVFYNPASIAEIEGLSVAGTYSNLYGESGLSHQFATVAMPVGQGAVAIQFIGFSSGEFMPTSELSPEGFDPKLGNSIEWSATSVGATYARRITDLLSVGATLKFAQEGIDFAQADYVGFDIGTRFFTGLYGITLGAAVTNLGPTGRFEGQFILAEVEDNDRVFRDKLLGRDVRVRLDTDDMQLPTAFRFGVQTELMGTATSIMGAPSPGHRVVLLGEVTDGFDTDIQPRVGAEYSYQSLLFLRMGKKFYNEDRAPWETADGFAFGGGLRFPFLGRNLELDYAYTEMGDLENVQTFSLEFGF